MNIEFYFDLEETLINSFYDPSYYTLIIKKEEDHEHNNSV